MEQRLARNLFCLFCGACQHGEEFWKSRVFDDNNFLLRASYATGFCQVFNLSTDHEDILKSANYCDNCWTAFSEIHTKKQFKIFTTKLNAVKEEIILKLRNNLESREGITLHYQTLSETNCLDSPASIMTYEETLFVICDGMKLIEIGPMGAFPHQLTVFKDEEVDDDDDEDEMELSPDLPEMELSQDLLSGMEMNVNENFGSGNKGNEKETQFFTMIDEIFSQVMYEVNEVMYM